MKPEMFLIRPTFLIEMETRSENTEKAHLFDINVKSGQYFKESDTLTPGNHATVFDTEFGKMGVMICYDIRFPGILPGGWYCRGQR